MPPRKKVKTAHAQESATTSTRRTTRASSKPSNSVTADASSSDQPPVASPVAPHVVKLRRGCLKEIPNFAVEIQLMIFGNLHPQDLFNLSRTSKVFHGFFLHRSNEALWEAALKNAEDLPERPPWMSIPAFIHLLYSTHCHNCGCPNIRKVLWPWFARYCSNCLPKVTCASADVTRRFSGAQCNIYADYVLHSIQAPATTKPRYRGYGYGYQNRSQRDDWYLKRHVNEFIGQWSALPQPRDSEAVKAFQTQHHNDFQVQRKYAFQCKQWHDVLEQDRKNNLRDGRTERFSAIVEKLNETGWEKDLDFLDPEGLEKMSRLPVVRQSAKLTDKGWEKVQEALHTFLSETRETRLKEEREVVIKQRFAELDEAIIAHCVSIPRNATMDCRPLALDLALQADLEPVANAPSSEIVTKETFATIVPQVVNSWQAEQQQLLRSLLGRFITRVPRGVDMLDLAIAIVYTSSFPSAAVRAMRYPYLLTRPSFRHTSSCDRDGSDFTYSHYAVPARPNSWTGPCDLKSLELKPVEVGIKWMRNIVTKLGLKPDTATFSDLEQCEARLRCLKCAEAGAAESAYTWETAFEHTAKNNTTRAHDAYPKSSHNRWARVDKADMARVKEREAVAHVLSVDSDCWWSCALCVKWKGRGGDVRKHLASEHNIEDADGAVDDGTIFWSPVHNYCVMSPAVQL
ncbi:hypothetical protein LXA43DRAFT_891288 [Ganoderma leucocontextum]|nr:hypothetical protein LXA43DRAFT_891288 [Ganoderma leucocontextum]